MNKFSGLTEKRIATIVIFVFFGLLIIIYISQYIVDQNALTPVIESNISIKEQREIDKLAAEIRQIRSDTAGGLFWLKIIALFVTVGGAVGGYLVGQSRINKERIDFENRKEVDSIYQSILQELADESPILRAAAAVKLGKILNSFPEEWDDHDDKEQKRRDRIIELTKRVLATSLSIEKEPKVLKTLTIAIYEIKESGHMRKIDFSLAKAQDAYWAEVDFSDADFYRAELQKTSFKKAKLIKTQFRESRMNKAVLKEADCSEANFLLTDLRGADFTKAKLIKTRFDGAKVHGTIIKDADFENNENLQVDISPMADGSMMISVQEWLSRNRSKQ